MTSQNPTSEVPYVDNPTIEYTSGKALMKHGPDVMHDHLSSRMEASIRGALPQMEVRFKNLSITADIVVSNNKNEVVMPTLPNALWQAVSGFLPTAKRTETRHILKDVNGVFKPGTMTLVLGQPGSGKSSLMKILSGRFPMTSSTKVQGEILYNGAGKDENGVRQRIPQFVSYVTQRDNHIPTLTVKETLEFAHECCGGELSKHAADVFTKGTPEENKAALEAAQAWIKHYPEIVTQQLGLEHCQDTVVGDAMLRGVSGGERKRVTTGEMQFGNKSVILMDEISTGLDSAASYDIVKTQRSLARKMRKTVVIALLQPSPEIFELFDDVLIMNQGRVIYHGPQAQALEYFESLGFVRPVGRDVADFLLDIGTEQQRKYETGLPPGSMYPRKASELAAIFENSAIHAEMLKDLHAPHDPDLIRDREDYFENIPEFHQSFWESTMTVTRRQLKVTMRNVPFIASRIFMIALVGTLNATVFWQFDPKEVQVVMGVIFQAVLFLAFSQFSQVPSFFTSREIFYKQRAANFYRTSSYVFAFTVSQIPIALFEVLTFGTMIYFMCGFTSSFTQYLIFQVILFVVTLAFGAFFFSLTCMTPSLNIGQPVAVLFITFFVLYAGFAISEQLLPDYLVWIYWLNPISWAMRALAINEYGRDKYDVDVYDSIDYTGQYGMKMGTYSLDLVGFSTDKNWIAYSIVYIAGAYVLLSVLSFVSLEYFRFEAPENSGLVGNDELDVASTRVESEYVLAKTPRECATSDAVLELTTVRDYHKAIPVTLAFKDLWYTVPNPQNPKEGLDLLKGINGYALPGTITALMGSSGAGKTTLMDVIAGRKTGGEIRGQILLNGHEATPLAIQRSTGYCEQMDIHSESSTFREAFTFSAFLRQDASISASEKYDWVEECIDLLDLRPIADRIIRGSSVEQMKRLTIGVELAAQPSVLFLDEPTSGLDARSAKIIMDSVRRVADTGRTVVCTIHQPSAEVFQVFDNLLLLKRGGFTVYFGELGTNASNLIHYLQSIPGVTPLPEGYNPATWMLEVIGAGVESKKAGRETDFVEIFNKSEHKAITTDNLNRIGVGRPDPSVRALSFTSKRAASESTQAKMLLQRFWSIYWRTPSYNLTRLFIFAFLGLIFGVTYSQLTYTTYQEIITGLSIPFMLSAFLGYMSVNTVVPISVDERQSYYRERASQTYSTLWYAFGGAVMEIPYVFTSTLILTAIMFPLVDFSGAKAFILFWLFVAMYVLMTTYIGMFFAFAAPNVEVATVIGIIMNSITILFMGFNPPLTSIPSAYEWMYHITPPRYALDALSTSVFGDCDNDPSTIACFTIQEAPPIIRPGITVSELLDEVYNMRYDNLERNFFVLMGCAVAFAGLALLALRFINHQKR